MSGRSIERVTQDTQAALKKCRSYCVMTVNEDGHGVMYIEGSNEDVVNMAKSLMEATIPAAMGFMMEQFAPKGMQKKTKKKALKKK